MHPALSATAAPPPPNYSPSSQIWLVSYELQWTPAPLPADAPDEKFSEGRALEHVRVLATDIYDRQVRAGFTHEYRGWRAAGSSLANPNPQPYGGHGGHVHTC